MFKTSKILLRNAVLSDCISYPTRAASNSVRSSNDTKNVTKRRERPVPSSQLGRLTSFGGVAVNVGASVLGRAVRDRIFGSDAKTSTGTVLSSAEVGKIVDYLCKVRGAAMKVGQMLSLQDEAVMDPRIRQIFERVRNSADCMPFSQAESVLSSELGANWEKKFETFEKTPFAAASIGQVHKASLPGGKRVAVKLQYPGVDKSIDSDINNLTALIKMWDIMPRGLYVENLMRVVRRELMWEVDYVREAKCAALFAKKLLNSVHIDASLFYVPEVISHLSTKRVLTTEFVEGVPIDQLQGDQELRNKIGGALMNLAFNEVFVYRFMQTDPNWANFIYNKETKRIQLLDFGAARSFGKPFIDSYLRVLLAAAEGDRQQVLERSRDIGFLTGYETRSMEKAHIDAVMILGETLRAEKFDFGHQNATKKVTSLMPTMAKERLTPPPDESYSLHRKFAGIFLLATQLGAVVPCRDCFRQIAENYQFDNVKYTLANMPIDDGNSGI